MIAETLALIILAAVGGAFWAWTTEKELKAMEKRLSHLEEQTANGFQAAAEGLRNTLSCALKVMEALKVSQEQADQKYLRKSDIN